MATTTRATSAREAPARSTPVTPIEEAATEVESGMLHCMWRMIYNGSYALAYGVVYPIAFVAQSLPQENPVMHGFRDGGQAAMDVFARS